MRRLVLASASPGRRELMERLGAAFDVVPSEVDERAIHGGTPKRLVRRLAALKARDVARRVEAGTVVIGADTVVCLGGRVLGKPKDGLEARHMLRLLSGRTHTVLTGVCVALAGGGYKRSFVEETRVTFARLSAAEIAAYVESGEAMGKAGAYGAQGRGSAFVRRVRGDWTNVVGLPLCRVREELARISPLGK